MYLPDFKTIIFLKQKVQLKRKGIFRLLHNLLNLRWKSRWRIWKEQDNTRKMPKGIERISCRK